MRDISVDQITNGVETAFLKANVDVSKIQTCLESLKPKETSKIGQSVLDQLIQNAKIAKDKNVPCCQDTGMAIVFVEVGQDAHVVGGSITDAINKGVKNAYQNGYFRKSVVDPITRVNTQDNTPAIVHYDMVLGDNITIHVLPKGFGSENMSRIAMLTPAHGINGVMDFVVKTIKENGANACPPLVIGVGIGGDFEKCAMLSKHALLRDVGIKSTDPDLLAIENQLLERINELDIGPMGFGGKTTALAVNVEKYHTHIAGLPVAVNVQCHALRHETVVL